MGDYNRGRSGGGRGFSSKGGSSSGWERRSFNDRGSRGPAQMHPATCDKCQQSCEVPFRPTQGKPVFCSNCFDRNRNSDRPSNFEKPSFQGNREQNQPNPLKAQVEELNMKLDKIIMMLSPKNDFVPETAVVEETPIEEVPQEKIKVSRKKPSA
ncbi:hypothetical protein HYS95_01685 [Candidatus Daviesbacteria bacterium]|nr:hypothetical protein [Candidatus Daviesbacteria bacterium]